MKILLLTLFLSGCQIWSGFAVRPLSIDNDEIEDTMPNPVFVLRAEHEFKEEVKIYYEHDSATKDQGEKGGLNFFGVLKRFK